MAHIEQLGSVRVALGRTNTSDSDDGSLIHAIWPVPEKGYRVLRVIYNETVNPVTVVTAYFDNEVIAP